MKTDKKCRGTAHAIFDHSFSVEELREAMDRIDMINRNPNVPPKARYELHHQHSSGLELDVGLQEVLSIPDDYRTMNPALRSEYPPERRTLSGHKYVIVAKSEDLHRRTAEELSHMMNQLHLLSDNPIFRGAIVHKDEVRDEYHYK